MPRGRAPSGPAAGSMLDDEDDEAKRPEIEVTSKLMRLPPSPPDTDPEVILRSSPRLVRDPTTWTVLQIRSP